MDERLRESADRPVRRPADGAAVVGPDEILDLAAALGRPRRGPARLGLNITEEQIAALRAQVETIDFDGGECLRAAVPARRDGPHPRPGRCRPGRPSDHSPGRDELLRHR